MVQFATDFLVSTLPMTPAQKDIAAHSTSTVGAPNVPTLNSQECTTELPPTSGMGPLLDTTIASPSSLSIGLVSTGKIQLISSSLLVIHAHGV